MPSEGTCATAARPTSGPSVSPQTSRLRSKPPTILAVFAEPSLAHETEHERSRAVRE